MNKNTDIRWLAVGAFVGLTAAAFGILRQSSAVTDLPETAVASINDVLIGRDRFNGALARLRTDEPGDAEKSITVYRMNSNEPDVRMPEIGRTLIHDEGVALVREWINSLQGTCE